MFRWICGACGILAITLALPRANAQPAPKRPAFEVATVKLNRNCTGNPSSTPIDPGRVNLPCLPVRTLIRVAYGIFTGGGMSSRSVEVLNGPGWIDSERYDIVAKTEGAAAAPEMLGPMLQTLLEDRFKLKIHMEARETSVYELTVSEKSPNLRPAKDGDCVPIDLFQELSRPAGRRDPAAAKQCGGLSGSMKQGIMSFDSYGITMPEFAGRVLLSYANRPVVDKTGLSGSFNIHLEFAPEIPRGPVLVNGQEVQLPPQNELAGPTIFAALQKQLGLKLTPAKAPLDVIVVDQVERPSEN
jgi:uncharacterized protein (TIGR03435 family)